MLERRIKLDEPIDKPLKTVRRYYYELRDEIEAHEERQLGHDRRRHRHGKKRDTLIENSSSKNDGYRPPDKYGPGDVLRRFRREFDGIGLMIGVSDPYQIRQQIQKAIEAYDSLEPEDQRSVQKQYEQLLRYKSSLDTSL